MILSFIDLFTAAQSTTTKQDDADKFGLFMVEIGLGSADSGQGLETHTDTLENISVIDGQNILDYGNLMSAVVGMLSGNDSNSHSKRLDTALNLVGSHNHHNSRI